MWNRRLLKSNARNVIARRGWAILILAALIYEVLNGFSVTYNAEYRFADIVVAGIFQIRLVGSQWMGKVATLGIVGGLLMFFVGLPLQVGYIRYLMESRQGEPPLDTLFSVFRDGYGNILWVQFITGVKIFLWSLLFVVPGIIKAYQYYMVPYLLAENPYMEANRAQQLSRQMMDGEKWATFVLEVSFFGWALLAGLAGGVLELIPFLGFISFTTVLSLPVMVYLNATLAELYAALRAKADAMGIVEPDELNGFVTYQ